MKLLDLNLLLYAVNRDSPHHRAAKTWLERTLSDEEPVAFTWTVLLSFVRLTTNRHIMSTALSAEEAIGVVDSWLSLPTTVVLDGRREHWTTLRSLLLHAGVAGNLSMDAHLAAVAIDHGCELWSTDNDFARFPGLRWRNPLARK